MRKFEEKVRQYREEYLEDLARLVRIESVRDMDTARPGAPFGSGIREAFDCFMEIGERCGFSAVDFDGYACHMQLGACEEYVGVLGHLDVVGILHPEQWKTPPYVLHRSPEGMLYARGVSDDKGPLLAALYAARILKDMKVPLTRSIRVIAGGAEETTWECMDYYFARNKQPVMGFSPDGNFPVVNGEKEIMKFDLLFGREREKTEADCRLRTLRSTSLRNFVCSDLEAEYEVGRERMTKTFQGKEALSRNPQRGENAIWKFAAFFAEATFAEPEAERLIGFVNDCLADDWYGKKSGLYAEDEEMGCTSVCPTGICMEEDGIHLYVDIRYPRCSNPAHICDWARKWAGIYGFSWKVEEEKRLLYVPKDSELVRGLQEAYEKVTGDNADVLTKGGASYARTLDRGVAFGAAFPEDMTNPHMPNEGIACASLMKAMEIYCEALWNLTV